MPAGCFHKLSILDMRLTDITGVSTAKVLPVRKIKHNAGMQKPGKYFPGILPGIVPASLLYDYQISTSYRFVLT